MTNYEDYDYDYHNMANNAYFIDHEDEDRDDSWDMDTEEQDLDIEDEYRDYLKEYDSYYHNIVDELED